MKLSMRCSHKFRQDADEGSYVSLHFHSADKRAMAIIPAEAEDAKKFSEGKFYEFSITQQKSRE